MSKFKKRPVVIEAVQFKDDSEVFVELSNFIGEELVVDYGTNPPTIRISTLEGVMTASVGDWIIKGVNGEFYPCKPDIFQKTYVAVADEKMSSFEESAKPLMDWMADNSNPHQLVIVDNMNAMFMDGLYSVPSDFNRKLRGN